jgi:hypothetical protein
VMGTISRPLKIYCDNSAALAFSNNKKLSSRLKHIDAKFYYVYSIQKVFFAGLLVGGEKGPYFVPHSVLLSARPGNIYLHKLDQEGGREVCMKNINYICSENVIRSFW